MTETTLLFAKLGIGALLGWAMLPVLLFAARRTKSPMPDAREKTLLFAFAISAALVAVPFLPPREVPTPLKSVAAPLVGNAGFSKSVPLTTHSPLAALGALFAVLVGARAAVRLGRWLKLQRQLDGAKEIPERVAKIRDLLCRDLGIEAPEIIVSESAALPFVTGALEQRVVLPAELVRDLSDEQLTLVLRHELIHVARKDGLNAALAELLSLPFPFHPSASRALADIIVARESAVDLRASAVDPHGYATLLVQVAERHQYGPAIASAVAMGKHALGQRLDVLTEKSRRGRDGVSRLLLLAAAASLAFAVVLVPRVTLAAMTMTDGSIIRVGVGEEMVLDMAHKAARIAIGDPSTADVKVGNGMELHLIGRSEGKTSLLIWKSDGTRTSYLIDVK